MSFFTNTGSNAFTLGNTQQTSNSKPASVFGVTSTPGNIFGNASAFSTPETSNTKPASNFSVFGNASSSTTGSSNKLGSMFANPSNAPSTTETAKPKPANIQFGVTNTPGLFTNASNASSSSNTTPATSNKSASVFGVPNTPGNLFNNASNASSTDTNAKTSSLFSVTNTPGSVLGNTSSTTASGLFSQTSNSASTSGGGGGGLLGVPPANSASTSTPSLFPLGGANSTTTSGGSGAGSFGIPPASISSLLPLGGANAASTTTTKDEKKDAQASSAIAPPPSTLRGKAMEEIVNNWHNNLNSNVVEFDKFGAEVAVWDRALIENGNNIAALYSHVLAAEKQQTEITEALQHIEQQQRDLASTLDAYERVSQEIFGGQSSTLRTLDTGPADNERDKNYMLATDLHTHLDDLSGSLTQMIDSVNALSITSKSNDSADDPMAQITQILSSHLESLQWIDSAVREVESKASEVEKRINLSGHGVSGSSLRSRGGRT